MLSKEVPNGKERCMCCIIKSNIHSANYGFNVMTTVTEQTWVHSPTPCRTNLLTLVVVKRSAGVTACAKQGVQSFKGPNSPKAFRDRFFKDKEGLVLCISSVQSLSRVQLFATPWTAARQAFLSITNSPEFAQTHVLWVSDAIQPLHPLSFPYVLCIISS